MGPWIRESLLLRARCRSNEERLHVTVFIAFDLRLRRRAVTGQLLLQLRQGQQRALDHGAGQFMLVDGMKPRR